MRQLPPIPDSYHAAWARVRRAWDDSRHVLVIAPAGVPVLTMARHLAAAMPAPSGFGDRWALGAAYAGTGHRVPEGVPFRAPHHTVSTAGLLGGGGRRRLRPGEATLAHCGMLYADQAAEFSRAALQGLCEPMTTGTIEHYRDGAPAVFPARFRLFATSDPCPCGYLGGDRMCTCSGAAVRRYRARLAPLATRDDLRVVDLGARHSWESAGGMYLAEFREESPQG